MSAVGLGPVENIDDELATERARMFFAGGCLTASAQPGLPVHEHAAYLAMWREAIRLAKGGAELPPVWRIGYTDAEGERACTGSDDPIGSIEHQFGSEDEEMQRGPMMEASEGRVAVRIGVWDAQAEYDLGVLMLRYLHDHPPPLDSEFAAHFQDWGDRLSSRGQERLKELQARPLRVV
jgi:hypothetical protein